MTSFFGNQKDYTFQPPSCISPDSSRINYEIEPFPKNEYWPAWQPGVYNAFYDAYVNAPNILACPEMMCGVPELIKATINGFQEAIVLPENTIDANGHINVASLCIDELITRNGVSDGEPVPYEYEFSPILDGDWLFPMTRFNGGIPTWNKGKRLDKINYNPYSVLAGTNVEAPDTPRVRRYNEGEPFVHGECEQIVYGASNEPYYYNITPQSIDFDDWLSICGAPTVVWPNLNNSDPWPRLNSRAVWESENPPLRPVFYEHNCAEGSITEWIWKKIYDGEQLVNCEKIPSPGNVIPPYVNSGLYPNPYVCEPDPNFFQSNPTTLLPWASYVTVNTTNPPSTYSKIVVHTIGKGVGYGGIMNKIIGFSDIPGFYNEGTLQYDIRPINNGWYNQPVCGLKWKDIVQSSNVKNSGLQILKKVLQRPTVRNQYAYMGDLANTSTFWYDGDLNGTYECYREPVYFRPELIPHITRNINSFPPGYSNARYPKEWDAELLFELIGKPTFYLRAGVPCLNYTGKQYELSEYKTEPNPPTSPGVENTNTIMLREVIGTGIIVERQFFDTSGVYNLNLSAGINHGLFRAIGGSGSLSDVGKEDTFFNGKYNNSSYWFQNRDAFTDNGFLCVDYRTSPRKINTGLSKGFIETCFEDIMQREESNPNRLKPRGPDLLLGSSDHLNWSVPCAANLPSAPLGTVKPHLAFRAPLYGDGIYSEGPAQSGHSAILKPILKPSRYINTFNEITELSEYPTLGPPGTSRVSPDINVGEDTHPYAWRLDRVEIEYGGIDYVEGDIFVLDYDPDKFYLPYVNGQTIFVFPDDECCYELGQNKSLTWSDTGGYTKVPRVLLKGSACGGEEPDYGNAPYEYVYQRVRVSKVDNNGKILSVEVLPWRKTINSSNSACAELNETAKLDYYVEYTRFLCHPRSVTYGGKYYNIGDTIQWKCDESIDNCEVWKDNYATATVVDVDENGSILDWHIKGSEISKWDNIFSDDYDSTTQYGVFNVSDGAPCYGWVYTLYPQIANLRSEPTGIEPDERGSYRFRGQNLCNLSWKGVGVPVRTTTWEIEEVGNVYPDTPFLDTSINSSNITAININITRQYCETTANIAVRTWPYSYEQLSKTEIPEFSGFTKDNKEYAYISESWYKLKFAPYPKCNGGGAEIELTYGSPQDNDSVYGSTIKSAKVISPGSLYAFVNKIHQPPILPTGVELIAGSGRGASISSFTFDTSINNFPNINYINSINSILPFTLNQKRFSYFPVTNALLSAAGSGYEVGQTFIIQPDDVVNYSDPWSIDGGDNPDKVKNGGKYTGFFTKLVKDSNYMPNIGCYKESTYPFNLTAPCQEIENITSHCVLQVAAVGSSGEITSLSVEHGGMMYRPVWTDGVKNPDAIPEITSTLGYGAKPTATINTDKNSKLFGTLTNFSIGQYTTQEFPDPYYPNDPQPIPGNNSLGYGRDYANPSLGSFWMLQDISDNGSMISTRYKLLAHYDWGINYKGLKPSANGMQNVGYYSPSPLSPNPSYRTHNILYGTLPNFVPKSTVCSFNDCYHDLLNKSYSMYRQTAPQENPATWDPDHRPKHAHIALSGDNPLFPTYLLVEYGFDLTLESVKTTPQWPNPSGGFGRTFSTPLNGVYDVSTYK